MAQNHPAEFVRYDSLYMATADLWSAFQRLPAVGTGPGLESLLADQTNHSSRVSTDAHATAAAAMDSGVNPSRPIASGTPAIR